MRKFYWFVLVAGLLLSARNGRAQERQTFVSNYDSLEYVVAHSPIDTSTVLHLNRLFDYYSSNGQKRFMHYAERALILSDSLQFPRGMALSTLNLAIGHDMQANYYQALQYYHQALDLAREQKNDDYLSRGLLSLGYYYSTQGNYRKAIESTKESARLEQELFGLNGAALGWANLGYYYLKNQQYDSALFFTLKSYEIFKAEKDSAGLGDVYYNLGNIAWEADKNAFKALNYCLQAQDMYQSSRYTEVETLTDCQAQIGFLYIQLRNYKMATYYLNKALEAAQKNNLRYLIKNVYQHKAQLYAAVGNFQEAYRFQQLFFKMYDSLYSQRSLVTIKQLQTEYELETQEAKIALLNKDKTIRQDELERQLIIRNSSFIAVFLLVVFAGVLYRNYDQKRRSNALLVQQKAEIEEKSKAIARKNKMLEEQKKAMLLQSQNLHKANVQIVQQKQTIEQKNKDITDSLTYAREMQYALLPQAEQLKDKISDAFSILQPRDIVSGDFLWFEEEGDKLFVAAIDCTGHGVPGAFMSLIADTNLSQIVKMEKVYQPDLILARLHECVQEVLNQEMTDNQDGMEVALCVIDTARKELHFAGARNHLFYIQNERFFKIKGDRIRIGGSRQDKSQKFTSHLVRFTRTTRFYLYTDGVRDQFGGPDDKKFSEKRLNELLLSIHHLPMAKQRMLIKERVENWMEGYDQIDDILLAGWTLP